MTETSRVDSDFARLCYTQISTELYTPDCPGAGWKEQFSVVLRQRRKIRCLSLSENQLADRLRRQPILLPKLRSADQSSTMNDSLMTLTRQATMADRSTIALTKM